MNKQRFFALILIALSLFLLIGCGKSEVVSFWNEYEKAVNDHDLDAVASKFAITENTINDYKASHSDYFSSISKIDTSKVEVVTECNFSSKLYTNNYYLLNVTAKINGGSEQTFKAYIREENNGMFFCSDFDFSDPDNLGNEPDSLWLKSAYYQNDDYQYKFDETLTSCTYVKSMNNVKEVVVPDEIDGIPVTAIYNYAFFKNHKILSFTTTASKLRKVTLPDSIVSINDYAFYQCNKLKEISIPKSTSYVGVMSFAGCRSLETLILNQESAELEEPLEVRTVSSDSAFEIYGARDMLIGDIITLTADLTNVVWSSSSTNVQLDSDTGELLALSEGVVTITAIGVNSSKRKVQATITLNIKACPKVVTINFDAFDRCSKLKSIYLYVTNPNSIYIQNGSNKFNLSNKVKIYVPAGTGSLFKANASWSSYSDQIVEME